MKKTIKLLFVALAFLVTHQSMTAQERVNVQTLQALPQLQFAEMVIPFAQIPEIADLQQLLEVRHLADVTQGNNAAMLDILDRLIDYNASKVQTEGAINWSLPKEAVSVLYNPKLDAEMIKGQFLQVVSESYQTVKMLYQSGKTPEQISQHLLNTLGK